jgi:vacuolar-type H+-ATPase subunit I/STV1
MTLHRGISKPAFLCAVFQVLVQSVEQRRRSLLAVAHNLRAWHIQTMKIKAIYFTMNMFSTQGKNYVAECWCPMSDIGLIQHLLKRAGVSFSPWLGVCVLACE